MLIVSDTSPITNLIQVDQLELLRRVFGEIIIPQKVFEELSAYEGHKKLIELQSWILVKSVNDEAEVKILEEVLDPGEAEAIVLAKELDAEFLIIDEKRGRRIAKTHGLRITGLLGVLIRGKKQGYLNELKPILDKLIDELQFRVDRNLYEWTLSEVGEEI